MSDEWPNDLQSQDTSTRWVNWLDDLQTEVARVEKPTTGAELKSVIEAAVADGMRLKPVGSGHSHSTAAQPSEGHRLVDLAGLRGLIDTSGEGSSWRYGPGRRPDPDGGVESGLAIGSGQRSGVEETAWVRVAAGTRIQELTTQLLPPLGLGLLNMGTFDGQTISGAINTGTHGTGAALGGFGDMVRSADLYVVVPDRQLRPVVERWRLESADGPTDPASSADLSGVDRLVQDDELFHSMVVGFGAFGIAHSYLLAAGPYYWLQESAEQTTVSGLEARLSEDPASDSAFLGHRHPWAFVNVAWTQVDNLHPDDPQCLDQIPVRLLMQDEVDEPESIPDRVGPVHRLWPPMRRRDDVVESLVTWIGTELRDSDREAGRLVAAGIDRRFIENDDDPFFHTGNRSAYYRVIRRTRDNSLQLARTSRSRWDNTRIEGPPATPTRALSIELSVPVDRLPAALDALMVECRASDSRLEVPVGIRFAAGSNHLLAPSFGRPSAFLELAAPVENRWCHRRDLDRYKEVFSAIGVAVEEKVFGVRPHLGKHHWLDHDDLLRLYPGAGTWLELQGLFNTTGTWTSPFTAGFEGHCYRRTAAQARRWLDQRFPSGH